VNTLPITNKSRLLAAIAIPILAFALYVAYSFYQLHLKELAFDQRVQGMSEYEVCQLAAKEFGMVMVKEMGCLSGNYVTGQQ